MTETPTPLLVDFAEASRLLSISRATLYSMSSDGRLGLVVQHIGRRSLLNRQELELWVSCGLPNREQFQKILQNEKSTQ